VLAPRLKALLREISSDPLVYDNLCKYCTRDFDRRSLHLNTEIGILIDSPELARQAQARFDAIAQPANCYMPVLGAQNTLGKPELGWRTEENGKIVETGVEPMGDLLRGVKTELLTLLPIDDLL
jgi:putative cardiolipin synthase